ncbi:MAG: hypothetical protein EXR73_02235 [Myxococcales bacterium]|nr:hypothetical protein [Myxococcales bacterium]
MARKKIGEILLESGLVNESQLRAALAEQRRWGGFLGRILLDMSLVREEVLVDALAQQLHLPIADVVNLEIEPEVLDLLSGEFAEQHGIIPFLLTGKFLDVAMCDPLNLGIIDEMQIRTRLNVRPHLAGPRMLERALHKHYGRGVAALGGTEHPSHAPTGQLNSDSHKLNSGRFLEVTTDMSGFRTVKDASGGALPVDPRTGSLGARVRSATADVSASAAVKVAMSHAGPQGVPSVARDHAASSSSLGVGGPTSSGVRRQTGLVDLSEVVTPTNFEQQREIVALQERVHHLEALVHRAEETIRRMLHLLIAKGVVTRDEILERMK